MELNFSTRPAQSTQVKCPVKTFSPGCLKAGLTSLNSGLRIHFSSTFKTLYLPQISGPLLTCTVWEKIRPFVYPSANSRSLPANDIFLYPPTMGLGLQSKWKETMSWYQIWIWVRPFLFPFSRKDLLRWLFFGSLCFDWKILLTIFSEMGNSWTIKEMFAFARHIHEDTYRKASDFFAREVSVRRHTRDLGWRWSTQRVCVQGPTYSWEEGEGGYDRFTVIEPLLA